MLAVHLDGRGGIETRDVDDPAWPGEARVRVLIAGICSTDLELKAGYMGFRGTPGHEFVGIVESAPVGFERLAGKRVVGEINAACGDCELCRAELGRHCPRRTVLGILGRSGSLAQTLWLPPANLRIVPDRLATERALFTEPVAAAFEIVEQVAVGGRRVLVMGDGKLGALAARVLALRGAAVTVLGRHPRKLAPLAEAGVETKTSVEQLTSKRFDIVVEATGTPAGFEAALALVRPRGTLVLKSTCAASKPIDLAPVVIDEITVVGSRCGPFTPALEALALGDLRPEETIDARFPLGDAASAFEAAAAAGVRKVVVEM